LLPVSVFSSFSSHGYHLLLTSLFSPIIKSVSLEPVPEPVPNRSGPLPVTRFQFQIGSDLYRFHVPVRNWNRIGFGTGTATFPSLPTTMIN